MVVYLTLVGLFVWFFFLLKAVYSFLFLLQKADPDMGYLPVFIAGDQRNGIEIL